MTYKVSAYGVGEVAGSFFFCFLPSSRAGGGGFTGAFAGGCSFFIFGAKSAGGSCFDLSTAASGFESGAGLLGLLSGVGGAATFGATGAGGAMVSNFRFSFFSFGPFGTTLGAAVASVVGGT